jgi:hypothetical protein
LRQAFLRHIWQPVEVIWQQVEQEVLDPIADAADDDLAPITQLRMAIAKDRPERPTKRVRNMFSQPVGASTNAQVQRMCLLAQCNKLGLGNQLDHPRHVELSHGHTLAVLRQAAQLRLLIATRRS